jgi:hypothetical protein
VSGLWGVDEVVVVVREDCIERGHDDEEQTQEVLLSGIWK